MLFLYIATIHIIKKKYNR